MAKKITIGVLLALILGGAVLQHVYVTHATDRLTGDLSQISAALQAGETEKAKAAAKTFSDNWEKEKRLYETLFNHDEIDLIAAGAARLTLLCAQEETSEALVEAAETMYYIRHIHTIDSISWENIF